MSDLAVLSFAAGVVIVGQSLECARVAAVASWPVEDLSDLCRCLLERFCSGPRGKNLPVLSHVGV
jgi:hypothetical protein